MLSFHFYVFVFVMVPTPPRFPLYPHYPSTALLERDIVGGGYYKGRSWHNVPYAHTRVFVCI